MPLSAARRRDHRPLRAALVGEWTLHREVTDHRGGWTARVEGRATFAPAGPGRLAYVETARHATGPAAGARATQRLRYHFHRDRVAVRFVDGDAPGATRPFHALRFDGRGAARATHLCGDDRYTGRFLLHLPHGLHAAWRVRGPRKDAAIRTWYARRRPAHDPA